MINFTEKVNKLKEKVKQMAIDAISFGLAGGIFEGAGKNFDMAEAIIDYFRGEAHSLVDDAFDKLDDELFVIIEREKRKHLRSL